MNGVFCNRISAGEYDSILNGIVSFRPLNPVVPGHLLDLLSCRDAQNQLITGKHWRGPA